MRKLLTVFAAFALVACDNAQAPSGPTSTQNNSSCSAQGTGNTVNCTAPTPTPTPTPGAKCAKGTPLYQEIVVQAEVGIPASQPRVSYLIALTAKLQAAGFKVATGGTLPDDEFSMRAGDVFSEVYDFWREDNTPQVLYQLTCSPPIS